MNDGSDDLTFAGGDFTGVTSFDGGDDTGTGDEFSPSDVLVIEGNSSGNTTINVANLGGTGAVTGGNGILVVEVGGDSDGPFFSSR